LFIFENILINRSIKLLQHQISEDVFLKKAY